MESSKLLQSILTKNFRELRKVGRKVDVNVPLNLKGTSALHVAAGILDQLDGFKICKILLEHGADVNIVDCFGITALHVAAQNGNKHTLDYLIRNGGDVLKCDNDGHSPYYHAYKNNKFCIMKFLSKLINADKVHEDIILKKFAFYMYKVESIRIPVSSALISNNGSSLEDYFTCDANSNQDFFTSSKNNHFDLVAKSNCIPAESQWRRKNGDTMRSYSLFSTITYMSSVINCHSNNSCSILTEDSTLDSSNNGNTAFLSEESDIFSSMTSRHDTALNEEESCDSFVTVVEEFLYLDMECDVRLIERRCPGISTLKNCLHKIDNTANSMHSHEASSDEEFFSTKQDLINSIASSILFMSENCLKSQLASLGFSAGPITPSTIHTLHKHLLRLRKNPNQVGKQGSYKMYTRELEKFLRNIELVDWTKGEELELEMGNLFSNPDPKHAWRCGISKSCFNYILLDPRVTADLKLGYPLTPTERFTYFIESIFYIGKGSASRPYFHLNEAASNNRLKNVSRKTEKIRDIWTSGYGVISLHVFQNIIPAEAWTREASMISAIGIENLTNILRGSFYGPASLWKKNKQKLLGAFLLYKAFNILIFEGERQIRPQNLHYVDK